MIHHSVEFIECDTCAAKSGSPQLCKGCLNNRTAIGRLVECEVLLATILKEQRFKRFLKKLDDLVFITTEDSETGKVVEHNPLIEYMEGTVKIKGEFDTADLISLIEEYSRL